jgi:hypothetical protein
MWSTATRGLWQHGPLVLMLVVAMLLLIRARRRPELAQYVSLPLAMAFVISPTAVIPVAVLSAYVLIYYRSWFLRYVLWAAVIAVPWFAYNLYVCGTIAPSYYSGLSVTSTFGEALLGTLIGPSRGWFFFSPVLLFGLSGAVLALRDRDERPLYVAFCLVVILHWLLISSFWHWWGGWSIGPRLMTDVVPFLCFFIAFNFDLLSRAHVAGCELPRAPRWRQSVPQRASIPHLEPGRVELSADQYRPGSDQAWDWRDPQPLRRQSEAEH